MYLATLCRLIDLYIKLNHNGFDQALHYFVGNTIRLASVFISLVVVVVVVVT